MDGKAIAALVEKSGDNWALALRLRDDGRFNAAANRLYYALFQAVKAYAVRTGMASVDEEAGVHGRMKAIVRDEDRRDARVFGDAMDLRVKADYSAASASASDFEQAFMFEAENLRLRFAGMAAGKESSR